MMRKMKSLSIKKVLMSRKGLSLMEVLVTIFIFSFVIASLYTTIIVGNSSWENNKVTIQMHQNLRLAMEKMKYDLQQASNSSISDVPADSTWYNWITFKIPSGITSGSVTWDPNSIRYIKGGTDNTQLLKVYNAVTTILANDISSVQFRRQNASSNILEVVLTSQKQVIQGQLLQNQLTFEVKLRN